MKILMEIKYNAHLFPNEKRDLNAIIIGFCVVSTKKIIFKYLYKAK